MLGKYQLERRFSPKKSGCLATPDGLVLVSGHQQAILPPSWADGGAEGGREVLCAPESVVF